MGEAWDDLATFRAQRAQCADEVSQLMAVCARDHPQHRHVLECRECYLKIVDHLRTRYLEPKADTSWPGWYPRGDGPLLNEDGSQPEWLVRREALLKDLEQLFEAVREYKVGLDEVDARFDQEKRRWYEQQVRKSPGIKKTLEELLNRRDIFEELESKGAGFEETVTAVREALGRSDALGRDAGTDDTERTLERLMKIQSPGERVQVYKETFFLGKPGEEIPWRTQAYIDQLQNGEKMEEIMKTIAMDRRSSLGAVQQKEMHRIKIEEFRRARAAFLLEQSKKATGRKDSNPKPQPPDEMYDQPPCHACGGEIDLQDYVACPLCQVLVDSGVRKKPTVFCSAACFSGRHGQVSTSSAPHCLSKDHVLMKKQESHVERAHDCAGGDNCAQMIDEDVDMDVDRSGPFVCRECTNDFKMEAVYCSMRCADINFYRHREGVHIPQRRQRELDVDKDAGDISSAGDSRGRYHSRDIRSLLVSLGDLLLDFQQRNAIEVAERFYLD